MKCLPFIFDTFCFRPLKLLSRDGTAKLADVGLAKTNLTKNYLSQVQAMGTFAW